MSKQDNEPTINEILLQYHEKFDDSEVRELVEKLEQMAYERTLFFEEFPDDIKCKEWPIWIRWSQ